MTLQTICDEFGVVLVPRNKRLEPLETRARDALASILRDHGEGHLRAVLSVMTETRDCNQLQLVAPVILSVSDVILAHPQWFGGDFLNDFDMIDLGKVYSLAKRNRRAVPPRLGMATMLFERLLMLRADRGHGNELDA